MTHGDKKEISSLSLTPVLTGRNQKWSGALLCQPPNRMSRNCHTTMASHFAKAVANPEWRTEKHDK